MGRMPREAILGHVLTALAEDSSANRKVISELSGGAGGRVHIGGSPRVFTQHSTDIARRPSNIINILCWQ